MALAKGTFEVALDPQPPYEADEGATLSRVSIKKQFNGDLDASSTVGRKGSFVLQHSGTMDRGQLAHFRPRARFIQGLAMILLLTSCKESTAPPESSDSGSKQASVASSPINWETVPSAVQGLPVPTPAKRLSEDFEALHPGQFSATAEYSLPPSVAFVDVQRWYAEILPPGQSWKEWAWCEGAPLEDDPGVVVRQWRNGEFEALELRAREDDHRIRVSFHHDEAMGGLCLQ